MEQQGDNVGCGCGRDGECCGESFELKCYDCTCEIEKGKETFINGKPYCKRCARGIK